MTSKLLKENSAKTRAVADERTITFAGFSKDEDISKFSEAIAKAAKKMGLTPDGAPIKNGERVELRLIKMAKNAAAGK